MGIFGRYSGLSLGAAEKELESEARRASMAFALSRRRLLPGARRDDVPEKSPESSRSYGRRPRFKGLKNLASVYGAMACKSLDGAARGRQRWKLLALAAFLALVGAYFWLSPEDVPVLSNRHVREVSFSLAE